MSPEEEVVPALWKDKSSFKVSPFLNSGPAKWHLVDDSAKAPYLKKWQGVKGKQMPNQIIWLKQKRKDYSHMDPEKVKSMFDRDKKMSTYDEE